jgi:very-short-patch-repair endonuclease
MLSPPEARLWNVLRRHPEDIKFRRQHPVGPYVPDFYCPAAKLAIEADGVAHDMGDNPARDRGRDAWLRQRGIRVIRFDAVDVMKNLEGVLQFIMMECAAGPSTALRAVPLPTAARQEG